MDGVMELFTNESEVWCNTSGGMERLSEGSEVVGDILHEIQDLFPQAYEALSECYAKSTINTKYFDFLRVRRFCKCNFGSLDNTRADVTCGRFSFERVPCPLRGECKYEGIICQPTMNTRLSAAETRVMRLVCEGMSNVEIADEIYISPNTVRRHVSSSYAKLGVKNRVEFLKVAKERHLFE